MDEVLLQRIKKKIKEIPNLKGPDEDRFGILPFYRASRLIRELVANFKDQSFPILKKCAVSDSNALIEAAYSGLSKLGDDDAINFLIESYNKEVDEYNKYRIAQTLGRINESKSHEFLLSLVEREKNTDLLSRIQHIIVQIDPSNPSLVEKGLDSVNGYTRYIALQSIIESDPDHLSVTQYLDYTRDPHGDVRGEAFKRLAALNREEDLALFYDALFDNNWHVASSAYKYLSKNLSSITPEIEKALEQGGGANFKRAMIQFLKLVKDPDAIPILVDMLISEQTSHRRFNMILNAIKSYKKFQGAAEGIFSLLQDKTFNTESVQLIRYDLWEALVDMRAKRLLPEIRKYIAKEPIDLSYASSALERLEKI